MHETAAGITLEQAKLIRHALGLDHSTSGRAYRRHYCAQAGSKLLEAMVAKGWMERGSKLGWKNCSQYYFVTEAGAIAVGSTLPD